MSVWLTSGQPPQEREAHTADEEHLRWAYSCDGDSDFVEAVDNEEEPSVKLLTFSFQCRRLKGSEEMSDDDEEAEMSWMKSVEEETCNGLSSDTKDGTKLLPLVDYILILTKISDLEGFVEKNGVEKIFSLYSLPSLAADLAASTFSTSVGSIVKFVLKHAESGDKLMFAIMEVFLQSEFNPNPNRVWDAWLTDTGKRLHVGFRKCSV
ncbi:unnamed protein product [Cylicocyclus nassatus]|uniref:Uncharacterized protein n=1 Tax=Cylicocyclus nassatus TaxID=53992 RepID=A0AA36GN06_CYLNA|nr:unnamed protein product [Cylicocyclus nassatus]